VGELHSLSFGPSPVVIRGLLRPRLTSRPGSTPSPFQAQGEISPGKNAFLHRATAGFTPPPLGHKSFADCCPLALVGTASYPVLVHRPAVSLLASSPRSVTLPQLRLTSLAVTSSRWDSHPQERAHAGRTARPGLCPGPTKGEAFGIHLLMGSKGLPALGGFGQSPTLLA